MDLFSDVDLLAKRAELSPNNVAMVELATNRQFTYKEFNQRANQAANYLSSQGVGQEDRVAILCHNCVAFFEILFACAKIGATLVPLNWRSTATELSPICANAAPKIFFTDNAFIEVAGQLSDQEKALLLNIENEDGYEKEIAAQSPEFEAVPFNEESTWYLLYTSGTTGLPKAVIQTPKMAIANHLNVGIPFNITEHHKIPNFLPLFHTAGINLCTMPGIIAGATNVVMKNFDPEQVLTLVDQREVNCLFGVPAIFQLLADHPNFDSTDFTDLIWLGSGGAPLSIKLIEKYAEIGADIQQGFGMTETGPTVFLTDKANAVNKVGSVGKPQLLCNVRVIDGNGNDVPQGEAGELIFKGPGITPGYWGQPEKTAEAIKDGWLYSGDVGRMDEDGYYYIVDRIKDMYISGGENVYPAEVERTILAYAGVKELAVVGVPDEKWGEVGCAFIRLDDGADLDEKALITYCKENLAGYKVPKHVRVVEDFPRTAAGKIRKVELVEMV
ncbi:MAG: long-chain fatty acid--CoA ligase [Cellvibrionaceae bacterium]